jgi:hypothetical protein
MTPPHIEVHQLRDQLAAAQQELRQTKSRVHAMCSAAIVTGEFEQCVRRLAASGDFSEATEETD